MFLNYLKTALRNLLKTRLFSLVNILGLAVGMTACLLILHHVSFEKSYDTFHEDSERIYRLRYERVSSDHNAVRFASCTPPAAGLIRGNYPEVETIARLFNYRAVVSFGDRKFNEERMFFAEPQLLKILKFPFIAGDPLTGIDEANQAFISQSTARKYFGDADPIGKTFSVDKRLDYRVTGVFKDIPKNSHLKFDILLSYKTIHALYGPDILESWGHSGAYTYLKLRPQADPAVFEAKLEDLVETHAGELERRYKVTISLKMQPLEAIHLTSHFMQEYEANGDRDSVNFLALIALFILIMAWVNYVNLSTARSLTRSREVGLRKVVGASRGQLTIQFFFEIFLINLAAVLVAVELMHLSLPFFTQITGTPLSYSPWAAGWFRAALPVMLFAGMFLSGLYPVAVLSAFKPAAVLKSKPGHSTHGINLRKILVVFQFVMAFVLMTATLTVYRQLTFMKSRDLGFNMDRLLVLNAPRVRDETFQRKFTVFKEELLRHVDIEKSCVVTEVPGRQIYWDNGGIFRVGETVGNGKNYQIVGVDYDFADVFDLQFAQGRNFSKQFPNDKDAIILNETAVLWMGFPDSPSALGQRVNYWGNIYTIIGVLKDYHQQSLKAAFEPHIFRLLPYGRGVRGRFVFKINNRNSEETLRLVEEYYAKFFPGNPFEHFFLDDYYNQQYRGDELFGKVFALFSFLAVLITGLGIFGLSSFMAVQRTREIGIRKVLGAAVSQILLLLSKDFLRLLSISFIIALPVSFFAVNRWLESFANRMTLSGWLFALPLLMITIITLVTIGAHVIRAALTNPIQSIRYE